MPPRLRYAALLLPTILLGAAVRFAAPGLPRAVSKYGGSALWAMAIFWLLSVAWARRPMLPRAMLALLLACSIECFKLVRTPGLDAFRRTLAGKLLLGRIFSARDLLAYFVAIALTAAIDHALLRTAPNKEAVR